MGTTGSVATSAQFTKALSNETRYHMNTLSLWRDDTTTQNDGAVQLATTKGGAYDDPERFDHLLPLRYYRYTLWYASDISLSCLYAYVWTSNVSNKMGSSGVN
jgi:hypothetical protein